MVTIVSNNKFQTKDSQVIQLYEISFMSLYLFLSYKTQKQKQLWNQSRLVP